MNKRHKVHDYRFDSQENRLFHVEHASRENVIRIEIQR